MSTTISRQISIKPIDLDENIKNTINSANTVTNVNIQKLSADKELQNINT